MFVTKYTGILSLILESIIHHVHSLFTEICTKIEFWNQLDNWVDKISISDHTLMW